jgi:hypothetical protein
VVKQKWPTFAGVVHRAENQVHLPLIVEREIYDAAVAVGCAREVQMKALPL